MNDQQLVTISITAEEFNRFQGDEVLISNLKNELHDFKLSQKRNEQDNRRLENEIKELKLILETEKNLEDFIKINNICTVTHNQFGQVVYQLRRDARVGTPILLRISADQKKKFIKDEQKINKIPKWIRKIFGAA